MSDEWRKLSDQILLAKQALNITWFFFLFSNFEIVPFKKTDKGFIYLIFFRIQTQRPFIIEKETKRTTKSQEWQGELYHQEWYYTKPVAYYQT